MIIPIKELKLLPISDLISGDVPCIYSILLFVKDESQKLDINTTCITLDQSLFIKAVEIFSSKSFGVVIMLGGSYLLIFVDSIGSLMKGFSLETVYGKNIVMHDIWKNHIKGILRTSPG